MISLRPYQQRCSEQTRAGWAKGFRKQLGVKPTGAGKTIFFAAETKHEIADLGGRVLVLAHRDELLDQAIEKIAKSTGVFARKEKAEDRAPLSAECVVASIQTMRRRLGKWPFNHFSLVVVDEAHHALADEYQTVLKHFDSFAKVLGVTATPDRGDRKNLGAYFDNVAFDISLFELIKAGYLSRIFVKALPVNIDLGDVKSSAGDYDARDLGATLAPVLQAVATSIREHAPGRRCLAFLPLIDTSKLFVEACQRAGINARHVDGQSPDRKEILKAFESGEFQLLSNAMLLTEGYDCPPIDCIINLRPTRSRSLYSQIVGRGTRVCEGKENLLLLDFLWQHQKHNLIRPAHLVARSQEIADEMTGIAAGETAEQGELDIEELAKRAEHEREKRLREELEKHARKQAYNCDAMDFCLSVHALSLAEYEPATKFEAEPMTVAQRNALTTHGIAAETVKSFGHAHALLSLIQTRQSMGMASPKQVKFCRQLGHPSPDTLTKAEASAYIDAKKRPGGGGNKPKWRVAA